MLAPQWLTLHVAREESEPLLPHTTASSWQVVQKRLERVTRAAAVQQKIANLLQTVVKKQPDKGPTVTMSSAVWSDTIVGEPTGVGSADVRVGGEPAAVEPEIAESATEDDEANSASAPNASPEGIPAGSDPLGLAALRAEVGDGNPLTETASSENPGKSTEGTASVAIGVSAAIGVAGATSATPGSAGTGNGSNDTTTGLAPGNAGSDEGATTENASAMTDGEITPAGPATAPLPPSIDLLIEPDLPATGSTLASAEPSAGSMSSGAAAPVIAQLVPLLSGPAGGVAPIVVAPLTPLIIGKPRAPSSVGLQPLTPTAPIAPPVAQPPATTLPATAPVVAPVTPLAATVDEGRDAPREEVVAPPVDVTAGADPLTAPTDVHATPPEDADAGEVEERPATEDLAPIAFEVGETISWMFGTVLTPLYTEAPAMEQYLFVESPDAETPLLLVIDPLLQRVGACRRALGARDSSEEAAATRRDGREMREDRRDVWARRVAVHVADLLDAGVSLSRGMSGVVARRVCTAELERVVRPVRDDETADDAPLIYADRADIEDRLGVDRSRRLVRLGARGEIVAQIAELPLQARHVLPLTADPRAAADGLLLADDRAVHLLNRRTMNADVRYLLPPVDGAETTYLQLVPHEGGRALVVLQRTRDRATVLHLLPARRHAMSGNR